MEEAKKSILALGRKSGNAQRYYNSNNIIQEIPCFTASGSPGEVCGNPDVYDIPVPFSGVGGLSHRHGGACHYDKGVKGAYFMVKELKAIVVLLVITLAFNILLTPGIVIWQ